MPEGKHVSSWLTFAGWVLVVAVLYFGRAVLMPIALAALVAFVLAGPVTFLQRLVGRTVAVLITVGLVFALLGGAMWGLGSQLSQLVDDLPRYRTNIREKIGDVREVGNGSVEKLQKTLEDIQSEIDRTGRRRGARPRRWCNPIVSACGISRPGSARRWGRCRPRAWW